MKKVPFLDLRAQIATLKPALIEQFAESLELVDFVSGQSVVDFEREFSTYLSVPHVVTVANGTDAITLALLALDLPPKSRIIVPSMTFVATVAAVIHAGHVPVFCDVDEQTEVMTGTQLEDILKMSKAKNQTISAVICVHLRGNACPMDDIMALAKINDLIVIEDAAQAHGTVYQGQKVGAFGDLATFSFYPGKNLGALGDGGAVVTGDSSYADNLKKLRDHGREGKFDHVRVGFNSRLDTLQARFLRIKLKYLDSWNQLRAAHARSYTQKLTDLAGVDLPQATLGCTHTYHHYAIRVEQAQPLKSDLEKRGVMTGLHYPHPVHLQKAYRKYWEGNALPASENIALRTLSLPMYPELTNDDISYVCGVLIEILRGD